MRGTVGRNSKWKGLFLSVAPVYSENIVSFYDSWSLLVDRSDCENGKHPFLRLFFAYAKKRSTVCAGKLVVGQS